MDGMSDLLPAAFADRLDAHGPGSAAASLSEAEAFCRAVAAGHGENFPLGMRLLPRRLRQPMANVYAFCRWADDLGDEAGDPDESLRLLAWWRDETAACFAGEASHPIAVALAETAADFGLDERPFQDLISAFEQDQRVTAYDTLDQLLDYCRRSADPVGRIVLRLCEADTAANVALSDQVCTGLQLINFWQDVARDADIGRRYLPADRMARHGYTPAMWDARETNGPLRSLGRELVADAEARLRAGRELAAGLRGRMRAVVGSFHRGGLLVARRIRANDFDLWRRPAVSKRDLAGVAASASLAALSGARR